MTRLEEVEMMALQYAQVPSMPDELDDSTPVWVYAIGMVLLRSGATSYVILRNRYGYAPQVIKAFDQDGVVSIVSIHPYRFLDKAVLPPVGNVAGLRSYLSKVYDVPKERVEKLTKDELMKLTYSYCIKYQVARDKSEEGRMDRVEADRAARSERKEIKPEEI